MKSTAWFVPGGRPAGVGCRLVRAADRRAPRRSLRWRARRDVQPGERDDRGHVHGDQLLAEHTVFDSHGGGARGRPPGGAAPATSIRGGTTPRTARPCSSPTTSTRTKKGTTGTTARATTGTTARPLDALRGRICRWPASDLGPPGGVDGLLPRRGVLRRRLPGRHDRGPLVPGRRARIRLRARLLHLLGPGRAARGAARRLRTDPEAPRAWVRRPAVRSWHADAPVGRARGRTGTGRPPDRGRGRGPVEVLVGHARARTVRRGRRARLVRRDRGVRPSAARRGMGAHRSGCVPLGPAVTGSRARSRTTADSGSPESCSPAWTAKSSSAGLGSFATSTRSTTSGSR